MRTLNRVVCWNKNSFRQFNFGSFKFRYSVRVNLVANFDLGFVKQELACNASKYNEDSWKILHGKII